MYSRRALNYEIDKLGENKVDEKNNEKKEKKERKTITASRTKRLAILQVRILPESVR
jgi:hypothetical protein